MATRERIKKGFSKLLKEEKLKLIANYFENPGEVISLLKSYWHPDSKQQQLFDEFSENTITNFFRGEFRRGCGLSCGQVLGRARRLPC